MRDLKRYTRNREHGFLRDLLLLAMLLGIPFLQFLGKLPLIDPDEGRYAEIPREMLERGDLITPTLNYVTYFEKPPLLYWVNAASMKLFGVTEFAARLPSALAGLLTVLATYIIARRLYDRRTALLSSFILGTSTGFVIQSRIILTDMLLTFCLTAALGAFIIADRNEGRRAAPLPCYLFYAFCALAVLAKGLIGIVFPAGIIFCYLLLSARWSTLSRIRPASGALLLLLLAAPWFIAVSQRNPDFARFFFIHEHFERFTSRVHGRYQPFWFFVPILAVTMLPWSFFIPGALQRAWRDRHHEGGPGLFLFLWVVLVFLFFSKSNSKLIPYILPVFPPMAILIATRFSAMMDERGREIKLAVILLGGVLTLLGCAAIGYPGLPRTAASLAALAPSLAGPLQRFVSVAPAVSPTAAMVISLLFLLPGIHLLMSGGRRPKRIIVLLCCGFFLLEILVPHLLLETIARVESPRDLALKTASLAGPDTPVITFGSMHGVSWYLQRRVMVTGRSDELEFGSKHGNHAAWFPDQEAVLNLWKGEARVLLLLKKREFETLKPRLAPAAHIIQESGRRLLISNR